MGDDKKHKPAIDKANKKRTWAKALAGVGVAVIGVVVWVAKSAAKGGPA